MNFTEKNFTKAKDTYRKNAIIQKKMAKKLVYETLKIKEEFYNVFEIGSGTGLLTNEIVSNLKFERLFLNDLTENFTATAPFKFYKGDILNVKIDEVFNLIMSNAVFQWIEDKNLLFSVLSKLIVPGGIVAFTTFGAENFSQIKDISGFGLEYPSKEDIFSCFKKNGFEVLYFEEELETLYFESVQKILEHIKLTGVGAGTNCFWTKKKYEEFKREYLKHFSDANGVELTYHPQYYVLRKN